MNVNFSYKLKASSIGYGILFFIISSVFTFTLILFFEIEKKIDINSTIKTNLVFDNFYGLTLGSKFENDTTINHIHTSGDTSTIKSFNWGLYKLVNNQTSNKIQKIERTALYGQNTMNYSNLYIPDNIKTLKFYGNIDFKGLISLPNGTIEQTYFGQIENNINQSNFFNLTKSQNNLPELRKIKKFENYQPFSKLKNNFKDSIFSFSERTTLIDYESFGYVNNEIKGNVILFSKDSITIAKNAKLEHVLIFAPIIRFESDFSGNVQAFATEKIICEENVHLNYPSVLAIEINRIKKAEITIGKNCKIIGGIVLTSYQTYAELTLTINKSKVAGFIFNEGKSNLSGEYYGHIYSFEMFKTINGSTFINHISDIKLFDKMPENYCYPILFNKSVLNFMSCIL